MIVGDSCDSDNLAKWAKNADVVVHEATNAYLRQDHGVTSAVAVTELCIAHGHSTPEMAGAFARRIHAKSLILNHFSARYRGDKSEGSLAVMNEIRQLAVAAFGNAHVTTAADFYSVELPRKRPSSPNHE